MTVVERTWGLYQVIHSDANTVTKKLVLFPSRALSLQRHKDRNETWVISSGCGLFTRGKLADDLYTRIMTAGNQAHIDHGEWHSISNISNTSNLELIEVQYGSCAETDIERFVE